MKKFVLLTWVLLLTTTLPGTGAETEPAEAPLHCQLTWPVAAEASKAELPLADLAFEPSPRLGLAFPGANLEYYCLLKRCGFGVARLTASWQRLQPAPDVFEWGGLDSRIRTLNGLGIEAFLTLDSDAVWGTVPTDLAAKNRVPVDMEAWTDFVKALIERYDNDGIDDVPSLPRPLRYIQVANEWPSQNNGSGGWAGTIEELIEFINATYDAVKESNPEINFVLGGIPAVGMDAMVLNAGLADYTTLLYYSETVTDSLTLEMAQDPRVGEVVAVREQVLAACRYDWADIHCYGPVAFNRYRIQRLRQSVGERPLVSAECGGPNLAYDSDITPQEHFLTVMDLNLDALAHGMEYCLWFLLYEQEYDPDGGGPTWGNSQLQLIDLEGRPKAGFWAYHLLGAVLEGVLDVQIAAPGVFVVHRDGKPPVYVAWQVGTNDVFQLPDSVQAEDMLRIVDPLQGTYVIEAAPGDGCLTLGPLPLVVSEELPGGAYIRGDQPHRVPGIFP